ncbi:hypothetical protein NX862_05810 [Rhodobacter sp. KR11]|uniref:calcium-binding protein n=1 Tax=Rhodobacter sp. KR11 TaxID=2974588 RepID=UPI00222336CE|nr:calcium-binding protein [Rhodobacter sp. KR11]MCW1918259.1 hypothetical protein [Rhodobacter sp. KR11]
MAEINAYNVLDTRSINLFEDITAALSRGFTDNAYVILNGVTYEDVVWLDFADAKGQFTHEYYGFGFEFRDEDTPLSGFITAQYNFFQDSFTDEWFYNYEFRDFKISLQDLYFFALTPSTEDDRALSNQVLAFADVITLSSDDDYVDSYRGSDSVMGNGGNDTLLGGAGADTLGGGSEADKLYGGMGTDELRGDDGRDLLVGGKGNDRLIGGDGADVFMFNETSGRDRIFDFQDGSDILRFDVTAGQGFADLVITTHGTAVWVELGAARVVIDAIAIGNLTAADFQFV